MNIDKALSKLYSLHQFGIKLGIENTLDLLEQIGNPHNELNCFHIAGSNGKGSTASFMASILMEKGFVVGLYTSPHLVKFNERIQINGKMIPDKYISNFICGINGPYFKQSILSSNCFSVFAPMIGMITPVCCLTQLIAT